MQDADAEFFPGRLWFLVDINWELHVCSVVGLEAPWVPGRQGALVLLARGSTSRNAVPEGHGRVGQPVRGAAWSTCEALPWTATQSPTWLPLPGSQMGLESGEGSLWSYQNWDM